MFEEFFENNCPKGEKISRESTERIKSSLREMTGKLPPKHEQEDKLMKRINITRTIISAAAVAALGAISIGVSADSIPTSENTLPDNNGEISAPAIPAEVETPAAEVQTNTETPDDNSAIDGVTLTFADSRDEAKEFAASLENKRIPNPDPELEASTKISNHSSSFYCGNNLLPGCYDFNISEAVIYPETVNTSFWLPADDINLNVVQSQENKESFYESFYINKNDDNYVILANMSPESAEKANRMIEEANSKIFVHVNHIAGNGHTVGTSFELDENGNISPDCKDASKVNDTLAGIIKEGFEKYGTSFNIYI